MIDWDRVTELKAEVGEEDFAEVVQLFLDEVAEELATLGESGGAEALAARLHFLKGSALNLGLVRFSELCRTEETAAARGDPCAVELEPIRNCFAESRQALRNTLA